MEPSGWQNPKALLRDDAYYCMMLLASKHGLLGISELLQQSNAIEELRARTRQGRLGNKPLHTIFSADFRRRGASKSRALAFPIFAAARPDTRKAAEAHPVGWRHEYCTHSLRKSFEVPRP